MTFPASLLQSEAVCDSNQAREAQSSTTPTIQVSCATGSDASLTGRITGQPSADLRATRTLGFPLLELISGDCDRSKLQSFLEVASSADLPKQLREELVEKLQLLLDAADYGNKAANLGVLQRLYPESVPPFFKLSSSQVQDFLSKSINLADFEARFYKAQGQERSGLTEDARSVLEEFKQAIRKAFHDEGLISTDLEGFLATCKGSVIVRSTGKQEDSSDCMLAGANVSVPNVEARKGAVKDAIAEVVIGYLSGSLDQRLMFGKELRDLLFFPVLIQQEIAGDTVSGVIFSREADGPTKGATVLTAAPGHGEGVVMGTVASDRWIITDAGGIYPTIREKRYRLEGAKGQGLQAVRNSDSLALKPCLSNEILRDLKVKATRLEAYYGRPVDIEFAVQRGKLWLFQVRVVTDVAYGFEGSEVQLLNAGQTERGGVIPPSFLAADVKGHQGQSLAAGAKAVVQVHEDSQLILAETVSQAAGAFMSLKDKDQVRAVLVRQGGELLSHWISSFRSLRIPVLALEDRYQEFKAPLAICPQRGLVSTDDKATILQGWHSHPLSGETSVQVADLSWEEVEPLMERFAQSEAKDFDSLSDLLAPFRSQSPYQVVGALKALFERLVRIQLNPKWQKQQYLLERLRKITSQVLQIGRECLYHANQSQGELAPPQLLAAKLLEAKVRDSLSSRDLVDGESLEYTLRQLREETSIQAEFAALQISEQSRSILTQLMKVRKLIVEPSVQAVWTSFVSEVFASEDTQLIQRCVKAVHWLAQHQLLDYYVNVELGLLRGKSRSPQKIIASLAVSIKQDHEHLAWTEETQELLANWAARTASFGERSDERYQTLWSDFKADLVDRCLSDEALQRFDHVGPLGNQALVHSYRSFIDTYDACLKALMNSPEFLGEAGDRVKSERFKEMLNDFYRIPERLVDAEFPKRLVDDGKAKSKRPKRLDSYFEEVASSYEKARWSHGGLTEGFSVAQACLERSGWGQRNFHENTPRTLADIWTLCHQNSIVLLSALCARTWHESMWNEGPLGQMTSLIERLRTSCPLDIEGVELNHPHVHLHCNIPYNNHSGHLTLSYNRESQKTTAAYRVYGGNNTNRWDVVYAAATALALACSSVLPQNGQPVQPNYGQWKGLVGMSFTWELGPDWLQASKALQAVLTIPSNYARPEAWQQYGFLEYGTCDRLVSILAFVKNEFGCELSLPKLFSHLPEEQITHLLAEGKELQMSPEAFQWLAKRADASRWRFLFDLLANMYESNPSPQGIQHLQACCADLDIAGLFKAAADTATGYNGFTEAKSLLFAKVLPLIACIFPEAYASCLELHTEYFRDKLKYLYFDKDKEDPYPGLACLLEQLSEQKRQELYALTIPRDESRLCLSFRNYGSVLGHLAPRLRNPHIREEILGFMKARYPIGVTMLSACTAEFHDYKTHTRLFLSAAEAKRHRDHLAEWTIEELERLTEPEAAQVFDLAIKYCTEFDYEQSFAEKVEHETRFARCIFALIKPRGISWAMNRIRQNHKMPWMGAPLLILLARYFPNFQVKERNQLTRDLLRGDYRQSHIAMASAVVPCLEENPEEAMELCLKVEKRDWSSFKYDGCQLVSLLYHIEKPPLFESVLQKLKDEDKWEILVRAAYIWSKHQPIALLLGPFNKVPDARVEAVTKRLKQELSDDVLRSNLQHIEKGSCLAALLEERDSLRGVLWDHIVKLRPAKTTRVLRRLGLWSLEKEQKLDELLHPLWCRIVHRKDSDIVASLTEPYGPHLIARHLLRWSLESGVQWKRIAGLVICDLYKLDSKKLLDHCYAWGTEDNRPPKQLAEAVKAYIRTQ